MEPSNIINFTHLVKSLHRNDYRKLLRFNPIEHPIVIQIGGNSPQNLAKAAELCQELGYDEVNINIGCPSERVQSGAFGACLMKEPEVVAECVEAMRKAVTIPVTIKTRLGVDEFDSYEFAHNFIKTTSEKGGVTHYIMHARKAYLKVTIIKRIFGNSYHLGIESC